MKSGSIWIARWELELGRGLGRLKKVGRCNLEWMMVTARVEGCVGVVFRFPFDWGKGLRQPSPVFNLQSAKPSPTRLLCTDQHAPS